MQRGRCYATDGPRQVTDDLGNCVASWNSAKDNTTCATDHASDEAACDADAACEFRAQGSISDAAQTSTRALPPHCVNVHPQDDCELKYNPVLPGSGWDL